MRFVVPSERAPKSISTEVVKTIPPVHSTGKRPSPFQKSSQMIHVSGWLGTRMTLMLGDGDAAAAVAEEDEHWIELVSAYLASAYSFFATGI